jgi:NAD(P)H-quinone oxidoreductase subunit 5
MKMTLSQVFAIIPIAAFSVGGIVFFLVRSVSRPDLIRAFAMLTGSVAFLAAVASGVASHLMDGPQSAPDLLAFHPQVDAVSITLAILITFVGCIVLRFSAGYLTGEKRQAAFLGWMCLTLASVTGLVLASNTIQLAGTWILTSVLFHRLLLFYPDRPGARRASYKKFLIARIADLALTGAAIVFWLAFGTTEISQINQFAGEGSNAGAVTLAAALLAIAAILKSAQFPTHGWLTEVMETPTPVSALLHAGIINAGGFVLIRFADVMVTAPGVLAALAVLGGFTAIFASLVMLTQSAVKTSLAWSTVAQMGFMILQCGLALFPLALLHILAHSLYKAHAFLSSGGSVERVASYQRPGPIAVPGIGAIARAFLVALAIYAAVAAGFGLENKTPQAIALGAILIFGVAYLLAQGFADKAPQALTRYTIVFSALAAIGYFGLQTGAQWLYYGALPVTPPPGPLEWALIAVALASFGVVAIVQAAFPLWAEHPAAAGLRVHFANGLYVNAISDRLLASWSIARARANTSRKESVE